jgi:hypothetical protein
VEGVATEGSESHVVEALSRAVLVSVSGDPLERIVAADLGRDPQVHKP